MHSSWTLTPILLAAAFILLSGCKEVNKQPIPGKYEFRNGTKARLELFKNGTYRLCVVAKPCDTGTYDIEAPRAYPDGTYRLCSSEGCGKPFSKEELTKFEDNATRLYFDGATRGPMKKFLYPPEGMVRDGLGEEIRYSEATSVEYDYWGRPGFTFIDPDSGEYFRRVSD